MVPELCPLSLTILPLPPILHPSKENLQSQARSRDAWAGLEPGRDSESSAFGEAMGRPRRPQTRTQCLRQGQPVSCPLLLRLEAAVWRCRAACICAVGSIMQEHHIHTCSDGPRTEQVGENQIQLKRLLSKVIQNKASDLLLESHVSPTFKLKRIHTNKAVSKLLLGAGVH